MNEHREPGSSREIAIGVRVFVHRGIDEKSLTIYAYGYGTYEGDFVPDQDFTMGELVEKAIPNPRIKLDNGKTVWGYECWWTPASEIADILPEFKIVKVDIDEDRREAMQISAN